MAASKVEFAYVSVKTLLLLGYGFASAALTKAIDGVISPSYSAATAYESSMNNTYPSTLLGNFF